MSAGESRNAVDRLDGDDLVLAVAILHHVSVLGCVVIVVAQDGNGLETALAEEKLSLQIGLADFQKNAGAALM